MRGTTSTTWAITMAVGVYSKPSSPKGPERDKSRYTTTPTTTEGSPMKPFATMASVCLPGKRPTARQAPAGRPISKPIATASPLTCSDSSAISSTW